MEEVCVENITNGKAGIERYSRSSPGPNAKSISVLGKSKSNSGLRLGKSNPSLILDLASLNPSLILDLASLNPSLILDLASLIQVWF